MRTKVGMELNFPLLEHPPACLWNKPGANKLYTGRGKNMFRLGKQTTSRQIVLFPPFRPCLHFHAVIHAPFFLWEVKVKKGRLRCFPCYFMPRVAEIINQLHLLTDDCCMEQIVFILIANPATGVDFIKFYEAIELQFDRQ